MSRRIMTICLALAIGLAGLGYVGLVGEVFAQDSGLKGRIAFVSNRDGNNEIYVMNADGSNVKRLTNNHAKDCYPCWSPDGSKISFESNRDGNYEIYVMNVDGCDQKNLTNNLGYDRHPLWSPDGSKIAFARCTELNYEIYVMNLDGSNQRNLTSNSSVDYGPSWSLDLSTQAPVEELVSNMVSETMYFETESPLDKWLNCRLVGPTKTIIDGTNMFTLEIRPIDYETRAHRYKWVAESWTMGDPNIQIALLLPRGCFEVSGKTGFAGREVIHGKSTPGKWIQFRSSDNASFWRKVAIGELIGKAVGKGFGELAGIAFTFASAAEAIGNISDEQEALRQFASNRYDRIGLSLPAANRDICAANIKFGLKTQRSTADRIGILLKADKRASFGQYDAQYHIIEFYLYPRN